MTITCSKQKQLKKKRVPLKRLQALRILTWTCVALATAGAAVMVYLLLPSADIVKLQASAMQMHKYQVSSELPNKRQLIVALQSIRMHNVTRYQRTDSKNFEESSISIARIDDTSVNLTLPPRVFHINNQNLNIPASRAAPVQQGW